MSEVIVIVLVQSNIYIIMQLTSPEPWENFLPQIDYSRRRYALGLFFILCQCIVWIAAAVITQFVYEENDDTSPFLMTCKSVTCDFLIDAS